MYAVPVPLAVTTPLLVTVATLEFVVAHVRLVLDKEVGVIFATRVKLSPTLQLLLLNVKSTEVTVGVTVEDVVDDVEVAEDVVVVADEVGVEEELDVDEDVVTDEEFDDVEDVVSLDELLIKLSVNKSLIEFSLDETFSKTDCSFRFEL